MRRAGTAMPAPASVGSRFASWFGYDFFFVRAGAVRVTVAASALRAVASAGRFRDMRLIERDGDLARIDSEVAAATGGSGGLVAILGPAGIGKSTLLRATCAASKRASITTLTSTLR